MINEQSNFSSDDDDTDRSYTIASVLPSDIIKNEQARTSHVKNFHSSVASNNQKTPFTNVNLILYDQNKDEYNKQKIYPKQFKIQNLTSSNQESGSISDVLKGNGS